MHTNAELPRTTKYTELVDNLSYKLLIKLTQNFNFSFKKKKKQS